MSRQKRFEMKNGMLIRLFVFLGIVLFCMGNPLPVLAEDQNAGNVVTPDNFFDFFDEYGLLRDTVTCSELLFQGTFGADVLKTNWITLDRPITITGTDGEADANEDSGTENVNMATLKEIGIIIAAEDVVIDHLNLEAASSWGNLIEVCDDGAVISNSSIKYNTGNDFGCAINVSQDYYISGVTISGNTIIYESHIEEDL